MIELGQQAKENEEKEEEGVRSPSRQESGLERFGPAKREKRIKRGKGARMTRLRICEPVYVVDRLGGVG